jgi:predicted permease
MKTLRRFFKRLISWANTRRDEERLRAEIEEHLTMQTAENLRNGLSPAEARRQAMLKFGGVEAIKEDYRAQKGLPLLETLFQDTRHALRRLLLAPAFTFATILTLALGIGATTSIFTLVHAVLLKSLPVANPADLYRLGKEAHCCYTGGFSQDKEFSMVSYDLYKYLRDNTKGFSELAAFPATDLLFGVRRAGAAEAAQTYPGEFVSGNYFTMFGINAYAGRMLAPADDKPNAPPAAVMSYRLWQEKYGLDPSVVGSTFNVDDKPFTVVGITPPGFFGDALRASPPDFFFALNAEPYVETDADLNKIDIHWLDLIGRIRPGAAPASIEAEMRVELKQWLGSHWADMSPNERAAFPNQALYLSPGGAGITAMRQEYESWLQILMIISGFVLLIVCANVANLMLVRGIERRRQISLSMALGAQPSRLMRQPLTESLLLSLLGGAAGLLVAFAGTRLILHFTFPSSSGFAAVPISASPSMPVLLFAFVVSLLTGLAFGIAPAWMATRVNPIEALRGGIRSSDRIASLPRKALVVLQAALSLALLSAAGLLATALQRLESQNFGFQQDRRLVVNVNPRFAGYRTDQLSLLYRRIHDAIAELPAVSSVALCVYAPQSGGGWGSGVWVDGKPDPGPGKDNSSAWDRVSAGYFDVIGTPILEGRGITDQDTASSRKVAVVSEMFVRKFFKNEDPIGKHFGKTPADRQQYEIVGVAKDARYLTFNLVQQMLPAFFLPEAQAEYEQTNLGSLYLHDVVIATRPGASLSLADISQAIASVDPGLPVISVRTLREQVAVQFTQQRLIARLTSFFGILSLVLASIGLYGVTAYNAARRVNEIGVRIALGASRGDVIALILRGAFSLITFGLLIGVPLTFTAGRLLGSQLYGVSPYNPEVTLVAVAILSLSALLASLIPALRASSISPLDALREE